MANDETLASELKRLREEQDKTRRDEIFGGLSSAERLAYDLKSERINKLVIQIHASETFKAANARQRLEWNKEAETDTAQAEARQPYRSREDDSANDSTARAKRTSAKKPHKSE